MKIQIPQPIHPVTLYRYVLENGFFDREGFIETINRRKAEIDCVFRGVEKSREFNYMDYGIFSFQQEDKKPNFLFFVSGAIHFRDENLRRDFFPSFRKEYEEQFEKALEKFKEGCTSMDMKIIGYRDVVMNEGFAYFPEV